MRAERTLFVAGAIVAAAIFGSPADAASERSPRQGTTQASQAQQRAATARPATPPRATPPRATAARRNTAPASAARRTPPAEAMLAGATPAVLRGSAAGYGTPILHVAQSGGLSCVPFARMATGMNISGDARQWWYNAAGSYARGRQPERGAVLAFTSSGGMSRGHVAVVSRVVNDRTILIDHSNWAGPGIRRGTVMRGVTVVDVSDRNDWTAVRVQVGWDASALGRTYPTHGFIYNRRLDGRMMTAAAGGFDEVAEATSRHVARHAMLVAEAFGR